MQKRWRRTTGTSRQITSAMAAMISGVAARRCRIFRQEQTKAPLHDRALRDAAWNFCRSARGPWRWTKREYVPRFGGHLLFWLHFCSGERRCEDVQAYLEKLRPPSWLRASYPLRRHHLSQSTGQHGFNISTEATCWAS